MSFIKLSLRVEFPRRAYNIHAFQKVHNSNNLDEREDYVPWETMIMTLKEVLKMAKMVLKRLDNVVL